MLVQYFREGSRILEAWAAAPGGPSAGTSERCMLLIIFTVGTCLRGGVFRNDTVMLLWPFLSAPSRCTLVSLIVVCRFPGGTSASAVTHPG